MSIPTIKSIYDLEVQKLKAEKAQTSDEERKKRFFDPKKRQIGIDVGALNAQVEEKKREKAAELEMEKYYELLNNCFYKEEQEIKRREMEDRRFVVEQLNYYRITNQRKEQRREFDLNDPKYLCKSLPMCCGDNDPRVKSKGSLLRFEGEDYDGLRSKKKLAKLTQILEEQIEENKDLKTSMKTADKEWCNDWLLESEMCKQFVEVEAKAKREEIANLAAYNLLLAKQQKMKKLYEKKRDDSEVLAHVYNCLTSDFFLENPVAASSALCAKRINASNYKGMSAEEKDKIKYIQLDQIIERKLAEEEARANDRYYYASEKNDVCKFQKQNEDLKQKKRDERMSIDNSNRILAIEQRKRREECKVMARDNNPTEEFYAQFNKTSK